MSQAGWQSHLSGTGLKNQTTGLLEYIFLLDAQLTLFICCVFNFGALGVFLHSKPKTFVLTEAMHSL